MIYSLKGVITEIFSDRIVIEVDKIGYEVFVSHITEYHLNEEVKIFTNEIENENDHYLVGFLSKEEKNAFNLLINVKGIGPKTALNALSKTTPEELYIAINNSNVNFLKKLPGIGNKAASQIVLDLKGKLVENSTVNVKQKPAQYEEIKSALKSLGFKSKEIDECLANIEFSNSSSREDLLRLALLKLSKGGK